MDLGMIGAMSLPELIAALVVGIVAVAIGLRKIHAMYASSGVSIAKVNTELDIITLLREQIQDLAKANRDLRGEIEELRKLNSTLVVENDSIRRELQLLRNEIASMQRCPDCPNQKVPRSHDSPDLT